MSANEALFVSCSPGLEPVLAGEVRALGLPAEAEAGGVSTSGPAKTYQTLNLWLRTAGRVLLRVGEVQAPQELRRVSLASYRAAGQALRFEVAGERRDAFGRAAVQAFGGRVGHGRGDDGAGGAAAAQDETLAVYLRVAGGVCTVSVDTSGAPLHLRGYRQEVGRAPMRETLAAGMLHLGGYTAASPLWDVMCGSGTLLVEGAEMALGLAAGRLRRFAFERFPSHDAGRYAQAPRQREGTRPTVIGTDVNAGALGTARRNARRAGVLDSLTLERLDATKLAARPVPPGLVVANLPYGKRVGEKSELGGLYRALGASLKRACPGWRYALLLEEGEGLLGLPVTSTHRLGNGGLDCLLVLGTVPPGR